MKSKMVVFAVPVIVVLTGVIVMSGSGGQQRNAPQKPEGRVFDENRFPIADFGAPEPADPNERSKRRARGQKYDNSSWRVHPQTLSDTTVRVDFVDVNLPAFPLQQSHAVVIGKITDARAYLSNDKTGVYSVFTVSLDEVLHNSSKTTLKSDTVIEVEREGGRVKFPSGKVHLYMITELNMLHVGGRYVLFLTDGNDGPVFQILTGYELREGVVFPLDELPNSRVYAKATETDFLTDLKKSIRPEGN